MQGIRLRDLRTNRKRVGEVRMAKEAYYFSHDASARNDLKIKAMISKYGVEGYGMFWYLVEMLREVDSFKLPLEDYFYLAIQHEFNGCSADVQQFVTDCIYTFKLFESDGLFFWSNSLNRRMDMKQKKIDQAREAGKKSAEKRKEQQAFNDSSTDVQRDSTDVQQLNEIKGNEIKPKEKTSNSRFAPPTQDDVIAYCLERKNNVDAQRFTNFYESKGWMIGKNKMKCWKSAIRTWEQKEQKGEVSIAKSTSNTKWDPKELFN